MKDCSTSTRLWRLAKGKTLLTKIEQYELKLGEFRKFITKVQKKSLKIATKQPKNGLLNKHLNALLQCTTAGTTVHKKLQIELWKR